MAKPVAATKDMVCPTAGAIKCVAKGLGPRSTSGCDHGPRDRLGASRQRHLDAGSRTGRALRLDHAQRRPNLPRGRARRGRRGVRAAVCRRPFVDRELDALLQERMQADGGLVVESRMAGWWSYASASVACACGLKWTSTSAHAGS